jgi:hypothetical protein
MAEVSRGETYQRDALNPSAAPSLDNTSEGKRTCEINKIMQNILQTVLADAACRSVHINTFVSPLTAMPSPAQAAAVSNTSRPANAQSV